MNSSFDKKSFLMLAITNTLASLIQPCNFLIDSMLTGNGLGLTELEEYALFLPINSLIVAITCVFSVGVQIPCSHLMGQNKNKAAAAMAQTGLRISLAAALILTALLLLFPEKLALILGSGTVDTAHYQNSLAAYLQGYAPGIPGMFFIAVLTSLLFLEGRKLFAVIIGLTVLVVNTLGDLANLYIFKKGLLGMALATSASNIVAALILILYFVKVARHFKLSFREFSVDHIKEIFRNGTPSLAYYGSVVIRTAVFNYLILRYLDRNVLAIMLIVNNITGLVDPALGGPGDATLLHTGLLHGRKDPTGMRQMLKTAMIYDLISLGFVTLLIFIFSESVVTMFSDETGSDFIAAGAHALRLVSLSFLADGFACILKKHIQGLGRAVYTAINNVLVNVVFSCGSAIILVKFIGANGIFLSYLICYSLALLMHCIYLHLAPEK